MATTVAEVMTRNPATIDRQGSVADAARLMAEHDAGDVIVVSDGTVQGIVTDRDIAVRAVARDKPGSTPVADIMSDSALQTVEPGTIIDYAVEVMRAKSVRRLPVVEDGRPVGIVSLGDLALARDPGSALADITAAEGNR
jgi:CBS domain-containing protein